MQQLQIYDMQSSVAALSTAYGAEWPHLAAAKDRAQSARSKLRDALVGKDSEDTSIVVFGSLARDEFTEGSDIDWTLLIDGFADAHHLNVTREIGAIVRRYSNKDVGQEATFGSMAWSHPLVHLIGGEDDSNKNTTQRILLLLESTVIGRREAYDRVRNNVLNRYILEDSRFLLPDAKHRVPRFLLNDFARYWRTMAVDFAYKRRTRNQKGTAIRNIKLRMSRKLIYVSGLLVCFGTHLDITEEERTAFFAGADVARRAVQFFRNSLERPPLEVLAGVLLKRPYLRAIGLRIFNAYDTFLGDLENESVRSRLDSLSPDQQEEDSTYQKLRAVSRDFRDGVLDLFFNEESGLLELTKVYGVF